MTARNRLLFASLGLGGFTSVALALLTLRSIAQWHRKTIDLADELECCAHDGPRKTIDFSMLSQLPAPVERYLRFALQDGQPLISTARVFQSGALRLLESQNVWREFRATQYIAAHSPGFVWDAKVSLPLQCSIHVRDALVDGRGRAEVNALSLLTLATVEDKPELTSGALMRYLAEAVWVPTALLPGAGIVWTSIDDFKSLATITAGTTTVAMEFHFGESGEVTSVYTPARYREIRDRYIPTPWRGVHRNYQVINGMKIPTEAEVTWCLPDEALPIWRGKIESIEYDFVA